MVKHLIISKTIRKPAHRTNVVNLNQMWPRVSPSKNLFLASSSLNTALLFDGGKLEEMLWRCESITRSKAVTSEDSVLTPQVETKSGYGNSEKKKIKLFQADFVQRT